MRQHLLLPISLLLLSLTLASSEAQTSDKIANIPPRPSPFDANLFQVSTLGELIISIFDGAYPVGLLRTTHGIFGIGTFDWYRWGDDRP